MKAPAPTELQIQAGFRAQLRYVAPAVHCVAVPNAAKRGPKAVRQAKAEGMRAGFPDMIVFAPGKIGFIEFKRAKGRLTDNQAEWLDRLAAFGFPVTVARSVDDALGFLRENGFPMMEPSDAA